MSQWKPTARQLAAAARVARESAIPLDRLPYTPQFDRVYGQLTNQVGPLTHTQAWHCLLSARKRGLIGSRRKEQPR